MSDRLSGISAFVHAVEAGSFALAAERLNLSRSAVSKSIGRLEDRLGVRLFHRTTRSLTLTDEGQAFHERCVRALAELEAAEAQLESGRREPAGRVRISMPLLFGRRCVMPVLLDLARRHPRLEFDLSLTDRRVDLVEDGFDLAIRIGELADSTGLKARRLGAFSMVVCATPGYLAEHGTPRGLGDLPGHRCIVYGRAGRSRAWTFIDAAGREHRVEIAQRMHIDDVQTIADVARAGVGLAQLPRWLVGEQLQTGALVELLPGHATEELPVHAVWPAAPHLPSKTRAVIDALAERIPALVSPPPSIATPGKRARRR